MKFSIIIPAFNSESTILTALNSVYSQNFLFDDVEFEVIIVNDGSSDGTEQVVKNYISKNKLKNLTLISKVNKGVSVARNTGIKNSKGDWIAFLDSDDEWELNKLQSQIETLRKNPEINFLGSARNGEKLSILGRKIEGLYCANCRDLLIKMFPQTSTAIVRRSILEEVGLYNERMTHSEDGELWLRIASKGGFFYSSESLVITGGGKHNYGDGGLSSDLSKMHYGSLEILETSLNLGIIGKLSYLLFRGFYTFKYIRRMILVWVRKI